MLNQDYSLAAYVEAVPICGEDFCDHCGDCLACYGADPCYGSGDPDSPSEHSWVVYAEDAEEFRAKHPG